MARKPRNSGAEDMLDLFARLPWWGGVGAAGLSYIFLHKLATPPPVTALQPSQVGGFAVQSMISALAGIGQYVVPFLALVGAAVSFYRRKRRQNLLTEARQTTRTVALNGISWREFELLVGEHFRSHGYAVEEGTGSGPDGGVDLTLRKGGELFLVQCKQWKALKVGVDVVRQLYGVMAARGATGGFVVTSGEFTPDAQEFAQGRNLILMNGSTLMTMLRMVRATQLSGGGRVSQRVPTSPATPSVADAAPSCPRCGSAMVKRVARQGANEGKEFWGCATFPDCRGTRAL